MGHDLVDADAGCAGKLVAEFRGGLRAVVFQHLAAHGIELGSGDPWLERPRHRFDGYRAEASDVLELFKFFL